MGTRSLAFWLAFACVASLHAQSAAPTDAAVADHGPKKCLMKSDASTWQAVGLTAEKTRQAEDIVARANKEYMGRKDDMSRTDEKDEANTYVQELKGLMTTVEYERWKDWCAKNDMDKDDKNKGTNTKTY